MTSNVQSPLPADCAQITDLIAEYAFGLTDDEQTRLVESSLESCPDAAAQLRQYRGLQDEMRLNVAQVAPPPGLGDRLMAAVSTPAPTLNPPVSAAPPTPDRSRRRVRVFAALAAAAVLALVATNIYWFARVDDLMRRHDDLLALLGQPLDKAFVLTSTDNLRWARLQPRTEQENLALLTWDHSSKTGLLYVREFPTVQPDARFELWLVREGERVSAGTFSVDETGTASYIFQIDEPIDEFSWARVTTEPAAGEEQPTVLAAGEL